MLPTSYTFVEFYLLLLNDLEHGDKVPVTFVIKVRLEIRLCGDVEGGDRSNPSRDP